VKSSSPAEACISEPTSPREFADALRAAAERKQRIRVGGHFSKHQMAGPDDALVAITLSTAKLDQVLKYEPRDLTISVQAGMPYRKLQRLLAGYKQMIPLDPPFADQGTIGGVVAANLSGPRRRQYGTARDLVIGMQFATLNGRLVQSGGMVVKNVAGLDMGKLLIGSFGTLGVMTSLNFKLIPTPPAERTFGIEFATAAEAIAARDKLIRGPIQPGAIDLMNPVLAAENGFRGWTLLLWFGGNDALMDRCEREAVALGPAKTGDASFWDTIQNLTPRFLDKFADGAVVRISSQLSEVAAVLDELSVPAIARAGTGVTYAYFHRAEAAAKWVTQAAARGRHALIEFGPEAARLQYDLWPSPGSDFAMMKKIKLLFDPDLLLNRGRLYRHL
jgi:glycolate oxidase FAD binding subunit